MYLQPVQHLTTRYCIFHLSSQISKHTTSNLRLIRRIPSRTASNMTTPGFTLPQSNLRVNTISDLSQDELVSFPAFKMWLSTLQESLARQSDSSHPFHEDPYHLRQIDIQAIDRFGGGRLGFIKMKAEVSNGRGEKLPGSVFLRGGSVGMLVWPLFFFCFVFFNSSPFDCDDV